MSTLDTSPPKYSGPLDPLDKTAFHKSLPILAVRVSPLKTATVVKSPVLRRFLLDLPKVSPVVRLASGDRLVLLRISDKAALSPESVEFINSEGDGLVDHNLELDYDFWPASEILHAVLPEHLRDGAPVGFAATGHLAHINLNEEYLPYKYVIGQIFLDKNATIKTVVNKLDNIDNQFRVFKMELLAGEPNYVVQHSESDCRFTFDFSKVYWNSRLQTEHARLVDLLSSEDVLADVFAGVGPFALLAAKKGCGVFANDLNPESFKYLSKNVELNDLSDLVRPSCEDGRAFIRSVFSWLHNEPFPAYTPKVSKTKARKMRKLATTENTHSDPSLPPRRRITHFVMNLPDTAILFLDAFRGVLAAQPENVYDQMPLIHCYCFTRELEPDKAEIDIRQRVEERLGHPITTDVAIALVRSVAPGKDMYRITFRLPAEVALAV